MRLMLACRLFLRALRDADFARRVLAAPSGTAAPRRSEALELLAVLQREGRLVDFLQEPIAAFSDAQIGAAVREVHAGCNRALSRLFGLAAAMPQAEGGAVRIEAGYDSGCVRLTGSVAGAPPYAGTLQHAGWRATRCTLPAWTGSAAAVMVVAPAEVEVGKQA